MQRSTSAVHPVWWLAPTPRPVSPWKYSWNSTRSFQCGSLANRASSPWHGRRPVASGRKMLASRAASSWATCWSVSIRPEPDGHSTRRSSP